MLNGGEKSVAELDVVVAKPVMVVDVAIVLPMRKRQNEV
jgi:hypothetical protein